jgi:hypothetical protein
MLTALLSALQRMFPDCPLEVLAYGHIGGQLTGAE